MKMQKKATNQFCRIRDRVQAVHLHYDSGEISGKSASLRVQKLEFAACNGAKVTFQITIFERKKQQICNKHTVQYTVQYIQCITINHTRITNVYIMNNYFLIRNKM